MQELISLVCAAVQLLLYIPKHSLPLHHPLPNAKAVSSLLGVCMEVLYVRCAQPALLPCCPHCVPPAVSQPWELRGAHGASPTFHFAFSFVCGIMDSNNFVKGHTEVQRDDISDSSFVLWCSFIITEGHGVGQEK